MSDLLCVSPRCKPPTRHKPDCVGDPQEPCRGCLPARAHDGLRLCWHCTERLGKNAVEAAELWSELGLALVGGGSGDEGVRMKNPGAGLNLKPRVVEARTLIRNRLVSWTLLVTEDRGFSVPADNVTALGRFLQAQAQWLAQQEFAGEAADEIAELVDVGRSLRQPSQTRIIEIGPCPRKVEIDVSDDPDDEILLDACPGVLRALLRSEASLLPSAVQCDADDEHAWDSTQWSKLGRNMQREKPMSVLMPPPKTLQERLDQTRALYARDGIDRFPVAVNIDGAKPVYGEFSKVVEQDDRVTRFSSDHREFVSSFAYELQVEARIEWSDRLLEVRFGDGIAQPYRGKVRTDAVTLDRGVWSTRLVGVGELIRYGQAKEGRIAA